MAASYLVKRNGRYHFRMRVPEALQTTIGKREIHRALHTSDRRLARVLSNEVRVKLEAEFATLRIQSLLSPGSIIPVHLEGAQSQRIASAPIVQPPNKPHGPSLKEAIAEFKSDRAQVWALKTHQMHNTALTLFAQFVGDAAPEHITRQQCRDFKKILSLLPKNWKRYGRTMKEAAETDLPKLNPNTVNRMLTAVSSFFNWAETEGLISSNPARKLRIAVRERSDTLRSVFSDDQLKLLFNRSPLYQGCLSAEQRAKPGSLIIKDAKYWLPLIALYTGMRVEEIAQLSTDDMKQIEDIWVFEVKSNKSNRIKTIYSERIVPVHSTLITHGFLDYIESTAKSGSYRLWPELERSTYDSYSVNFSKWFGRYKRQIGITDPMVSFHSFRHTAINTLKQADVNETKIAELVGHKNASITTGRYGKRYEPEKLRTAIEHLSYPISLASSDLAE